LNLSPSSGESTANLTSSIQGAENNDFDETLPAPFEWDLKRLAAAQRFEAFVRPFLVRAHQGRIAGHIGGEDGGEAADRGHFRVPVVWLNQSLP
jgi:hypothetical protein